MLFIIIHQTKELWLKQVIEELLLARSLVHTDRLVEAYKGLARVSRIQAVMTLSWEVLTTMTPSDYSSFRHVLGTSSGFQSDQFRAVETLLGVRGGGVPGALTQRYAARAEPVGRSQCRARPRGLRAAGGRARARLAAAHISRARRSRTAGRRSINSRSAGGSSTSSPRNWSTSTMRSPPGGTSMCSTVSRVIGGKRGTGGTAGVPYLESTLAKRAFPELWSLRTRL